MTSPSWMRRDPRRNRPHAATHDPALTAAVRHMAKAAAELSATRPFDDFTVRYLDRRTHPSDPPLLEAVVFPRRRQAPPGTVCDVTLAQDPNDHSSHDHIPAAPPSPGEFECCASGSCEVCRPGAGGWGR